MDRLPEYTQRNEHSLHRNRYDIDSLGTWEPRWPQWAPGLYKDPIAIWLEGGVDQGWIPLLPLGQNVEESEL